MDFTRHTTKEKLLLFLQKTDELFPVPLSKKTNLSDYADKLVNCGSLFMMEQNNIIVALVGGYIREVENELAYISIVAVLPDFQGKGLGKKLLRCFLARCRTYGRKAVHVYAVENNTPAMQLYRSVGFVDYHPEKEKRPMDKHLIYYIETEEEI